MHLRDTALKLLVQIKNQRENIIAPVDIFGCHIVPCNDKTSLTYKFQILIKLILSVQTKDEITHEALYSLNNKLIKKTKQELGIDNLYYNMNVLEKTINKVGFYHKKIIYIKNITAKLHINPNLLNDISIVKSFNGVGPKISALYSQYGLNKFIEHSVDLHVHRILNRIQFVNTKTPIQTQNILKCNEIKFNINNVLVGFGQIICKAKPLCTLCSINRQCPYNNKFINW